MRRKITVITLIIAIIISMMPVASFGATKKPGAVKLTYAEFTDWKTLEYGLSNGAKKVVSIKAGWTSVKCDGYQVKDNQKGEHSYTYTTKKNTFKIQGYGVADYLGDSIYQSEKEAEVSIKVRAFNKYKQKQYLNSKGKWVTKKPRIYKKTRNATKKLYGKWSNTLKVNIETGKDIPEKKAFIYILDTPMRELTESELREGIRSELEKLTIKYGGQKYYKGGKITLVKGLENETKAILEFVNTYNISYGEISEKLFRLEEKLGVKESNAIYRKYGSTSEGINIHRNQYGEIEDNEYFGVFTYSWIFNMEPSETIRDVIKQVERHCGKGAAHYHSAGVARDGNHVIVVFSTAYPY